MIVPLSLFGSVPIAILQYDDEPADWAPNVKMAHHHYPGTKTTETQFLGEGLLDAEHLVHLESPAAFQSLYALFQGGALQTLRTPTTVSAFAGDQEITEGGITYKVWTAVRITAMSEVHPRYDGTVRCRCTFSRSPGA